MRKFALAAGLAMLTALLAGVGSARAEDIKGKFYVSGDLGVLVTTDNIRSNAALIIAPLGADGVPFTGDKGEIISCNATNASVFCDPRPDDLIAREGNLEQTVAYTGSVGYGLTSKIALQLDIGYYKGQIRNIDVFTSKNVPAGGSPNDPCVKAGNEPCLLTFLKTETIKSPFTAGTLTETPIMLDALYRFRTDSNFNPYLGMGAGVLTTKLNESPKVSQLNDRFKSLHLIQITDAFGPVFGTTFAFDADGNAPYTKLAKLESDGGFVGQILAGGEYFFNDRISVSLDMRYMLANHDVRLTFGGTNQIDLTSWTEDMFRSDGSLRVFRNGNTLPPNPIDPNSTNMAFRYDCDVNNNGDITDDLGKDYNGDGFMHADPVTGKIDPRIQSDACFKPSPGVLGQPIETIVAQGGIIKLTHFNFGFGVKFHF